jgi:hypothetical protein
MDISYEKFFEAFKAAVIHNGTVPNGDDFTVVLTSGEIENAAEWMWQEIKGA